MHRCALTEINFLPALHKEDLHRAGEWYLVLKRTPPIGERERPNCYRRFGLMQLLNEEALVGRTWDDMIMGYIEPRQ